MYIYHFCIDSRYGMVKKCQSTPWRWTLDRFGFWFCDINICETSPVHQQGGLTWSNHWIPLGPSWHVDTRTHYIHVYIYMYIRIYVYDMDIYMHGYISKDIFIYAYVYAYIYICTYVNSIPLNTKVSGIEHQEI